MPCGSVRMRSYPLAAQTNASAMPVFPLVASTIVVRPGSIRPSASAASIIATPMRSLTEPPGLNISSFANSSAPSGAIRVSWTIGVRPTWSAMLIGIPGIRCSGYRGLPAEGRGERLGEGLLLLAAGAEDQRLVLELEPPVAHGAARLEPVGDLDRRGRERQPAAARGLEPTDARRHGPHEVERVAVQQADPPPPVGVDQRGGRVGVGHALGE